MLPSFLFSQLILVFSGLNVTSATSSRHDIQKSLPVPRWNSCRRTAHSLWLWIENPSAAIENLSSTRLPTKWSYPYIGSTAHRMEERGGWEGPWVQLTRGHILYRGDLWKPKSAFYFSTSNLMIINFYFWKRSILLITFSNQLTNHGHQCIITLILNVTT